MIWLSVNLDCFIAELSSSLVENSTFNPVCLQGVLPLLDRFVVIEIKRPTNSQFRSIVKSMLVKAGLNYSSEAFEILSADPSSLRHLKRRIERLAHSAKNRLITEIDCARVLTD